MLERSNDAYCPVFQSSSLVQRCRGGLPLLRMRLVPYKDGSVMLLQKEVVARMLLSNLR